MPHDPTLLVRGVAATCMCDRRGVWLAHLTVQPALIISQMNASLTWHPEHERCISIMLMPCIQSVLTQGPGLWLRTAALRQRRGGRVAHTGLLLHRHPPGCGVPMAGLALRLLLQAPRRHGRLGCGAPSPAAAAPPAARGSGGGPARRREGRSCGGATGATAATVPASCCDAVAEGHQHGRCSYLINVSICYW